MAIEMPKLMCTCGEVLDLSPVPTPGELRFFREEDWDHVVATLVRGVEGRGVRGLRIDEAISDALAGAVGSGYTCARCGRLVVPKADLAPERASDPFERPEAEPIRRAIATLKQGQIPDERCTFCGEALVFEAWGPPGATVPSSFRWTCPCRKSNGKLLGL